MKNEYEVLSHIEKNENTSQRKIAMWTGLSVGTVNLLLKKMARKGLVKIERLNAKSLRYLITPQGIAEKTRLAYQFLKSSYKQVVRIETVLKRLIDEYQVTQRDLDLIFYGSQDEVLEMLKIAAGNLGLKYRVIVLISELGDCIEKFDERQYLGGVKSRNILVISWKSEKEENLPDNIRLVNILNIL